MSKTKRNGGYVLVDFSGVNLITFDTPQATANPVYDSISNAIDNNKPVYVSNLAIGPTNISPLNVPFYKTASGIQGMFSTFGVSVGHTDDGDVVVISQM